MKTIFFLIKIAEQLELEDPFTGKYKLVLVAGHTSALRRRSEIRAMPEIEKPPAKPLDIYYGRNYHIW